jgi:hypothetical protein
MSVPHHFTAQVLPGGRIEITAPELPEGELVDVVVVSRPRSDSDAPSLMDFFNSLPPGPRSAPTWEEFERQFQEERNAWER